LIWMAAQQSCANGQSKKRWSMVSGMPLLHMTQLTSSWMFMCLRCNISFVFNRSTNTNKKKELNSRRTSWFPDDLED
jgi:hypothetical protein